MVEWSGTVVLTTPRLLLRTFRRDDLPSYAALNADPDVARGWTMRSGRCASRGSSRSPTRQTCAAWR